MSGALILNVQNARIRAIRFKYFFYNDSSRIVLLPLDTDVTSNVWDSLSLRFYEKYYYKLPKSLVSNTSHHPFSYLSPLSLPSPVQNIYLPQTFINHVCFNINIQGLKSCFFYSSPITDKASIKDLSCGTVGPPFQDSIYKNNIMFCCCSKLLLFFNNIIPLNTVITKKICTVIKHANTASQSLFASRTGGSQNSENNLQSTFS